MKTILCLLIIIGVAYVASKPIDNEEIEDAEIAVINDSEDVEKRKEVPRQQAKKEEGNYIRFEALYMSLKEHWCIEFLIAQESENLQREFYLSSLTYR